MGTVPRREHEPTREEQVESFTRSIVAGHPEGAVRRIVLYAVVGLSLVALIGAAGLLGILAGGLGLIALLLLAMTDQLA